MTYAGFRFTGRFATLERPADRPPATEGDAWAQDKIDGVGGTEVDATWTNRLKANLENLITRLNGDPNAGDDQLANAIGDAVESKADADHDHDAIYYRKTEVDAAVAGLQPTSQKGVASGYAGLDGSGKVPTSQLPDAVLGNVDFKGLWNANTNSPALSGTGTKGHYYVVSTAGATSLGGITDWVVGDWAISDGTAWRKVDNTDAIASVAGLTGSISAAALKTALAYSIADITGLQTALDAKVPTANIINNLTTNDSAKPLSAAQGKALNDTLTAMAAAQIWASQPIGVPIPVYTSLWTTLTDALPPTNNAAFRYILLTAGEADAGEYNEGVLTSESVSGSAPLVLATGVINLAGSPINGKTVDLLNTSRRFLRAGSVGTAETDQMQQILGSLTLPYCTGNSSSQSGALSKTASGSSAPASSSNGGSIINFDSAGSSGARTGTETRSKNIGMTYIMRIK